MKLTVFFPQKLINRCNLAFTVCLIVAFFNNNFTIKILRKVKSQHTDCIDVFCIRICFPFSLHIIKLLFVIKVSRKQ